MNRNRFFAAGYAAVMLGLALLLAPRTSDARVRRDRTAAPAAVTALLDTAAKAIGKPDKDALKPLTDGDPAKVYYWQFRSGTGPGFGFARRNWKTAALQAPGSDAWVAVFWDYQPCESQGDHVHRLVRRGDAWKIGPEVPETETNGFHIRDHRLAVRFDLPKHVARISDTVSIVRDRADASTLQLRLAADFPVETVTQGAKSLPFVQAGGVIYIAPPGGSRFDLNLTYSGTAYHPGMFVGNYVTEKEVVLSAYWYPVIGRLPAPHSVTVTVPHGWTAIGQGDEVSHTDSAEASTYAFHMAVPTTYFTLDAAPYFVYKKEVNGRTYQVYLTREGQERAKKQLDGMDASFRLFERLWGPYPWPKYTIVETGQPGWPGALEAYSFTTYGQGLIPGDNPHEWGHTWWGGFVPNTYLKDIWNESVTTYAESVFYRYGKGDDSSRAALDKVFWRRPFPGLEREADRLPLAQTWDALYMPCSTVGYVKGGLVMQNLEDTLGFETLEKSLHALRDRFYGSGKAATWEDVVKAVEATTGHDYRWWYEQWIARPGLPRLSWENVTAHQSGTGYTVDAAIVQTGTPYRLRVPVWLETENGQIVRSTADVEKASTHVRLTANSAPVRLLLDPEIRLPRVVTTQETPRFGIPGKALVVASEGGMERAKKLDNGDRTIKAASEVQDADLKGQDLVLIGSAETNAIWARLKDRAPFEIHGADVVFHGRTHIGASASAVTPNPLSPGKTITWLTEQSPNLPRSGFGDMGNPTSAAVYAPNGDLLDADLALTKAGPTVYEFAR